MDLPLCSRPRMRLSLIAVLVAMCVIAGSDLVPAEEEAQLPEKYEQALRYDPKCPDSMVVATVNWEPVTVREVLEPFRTYLEEKFLDYEIPAKDRGKIREAWVKFALADVIERKLQAQGFQAELNEMEQQALEEHVERGWLDFTAGLQKKRGLSTMQDLADAMQEKGTDLAFMKQHWREGYIAHQFKLSTADPPLEPKSQELHDYYDEHEGEWNVPARVKWQQIVVRRQKEEESASAKSRALAVLEKLKSGTDFSELARAHSEGPTKAQGGNWDWTDCDSLACEELGDFLSTAKVGSTSEVICHDGKFHIVRILEREEASRKSFEDVEAEICDTLKKAHRERLIREAVQKLAGKALIQTVFRNKWKFEKRAPDEMPKVTLEASDDSETTLEGSPFGEALTRPVPDAILPGSLEDEEDEP